MKHDMRPWQAIIGEHFAFATGLNGKTTIAELHNIGSVADVTRRAYLMAAAPDLYEALDSIVEAEGKYYGIGKLDGLQMQRARAALAKARGETFSNKTEKSMNYAWANPSTGIREQAPTLEEAKRRAWQEIQPGSQEALIWEQEPVGQVGMTSYQLDNRIPWDSYAWASPRDGYRMVRSTWEAALEAIQQSWPEHDVSESVTVYRQRPACSVSRSDVPPAPPAPPQPAAPIQETPDSMLLKVQSGEADLGTASVLGMLWIAQALQKLAGAPLTPEFLTDHEIAKIALAESPGERRARLVRERNTPHSMTGSGPLCKACGMPKEHSNHGWTGE